MHPCLILLPLFLLLSATVSASDSDSYLGDVRPVLKERCFACHGALKQEAGLRLDTVALMLQGGDSGAAIVASQPDTSLLLQRVTSSDPATRMPPEGEPLKPEQLAAIRQWIQSGAAAPDNDTPEKDPRDHWAFQPPTRPSVPLVKRADWQQNPIDAFIAARHDEFGLVPQPAASPELWLRRVYIDLIGFPPSSAEIRSFLEDPSPDAEARIVDRLLNSPQYGERWGRHWMDIWRYSDWWGLGAEVRNSQKHIWHWRDWVIESLNADVGYDQMLREMLAADELYPNDLNKLRASGFLARQYFKFNRTSWLDETIQHTSKAMLGLTFNCSKCHDHKYDPISQLEYYQLRAFFEPYQVRTDAVGDVLDFEVNGIPRAFDCNLDAQTWLHIRGDDRNPDLSSPVTPRLPAFLAFDDFPVTPVQLPVEAIQPGLRPHVIQARLKAAQQEITAAQNELNQAQKQLESAREAANAPKPAPPETLPDPLVVDDFTAEHPDLWEVRSGAWAWTNGHLVQSQVGPQSARLALRRDVPENFEATFRYIPRAGELWKSVGLQFDTHADNHVFVYLSSYADGPKVQLSWTLNGQTIYPPDAAQPRAIDLNAPQLVTIRTQGTLINVLVNGELTVAKRLPFPRHTGPIELVTFDAQAEFTEFRLAQLPDSAQLHADPTAPNTSSPLTVDQALAAVEVAAKALQSAELGPATIHAKVAAQRAILEQPESAETARLVHDAARAEKQMALGMAESAVARAQLDLLKATPAKHAEAAKKLEETQQALQQHQQALDQPGSTFNHLTGALKTLENNLESEESRRKPFPATSTGRRSALAHWITDPRNPLTARVAVNHLWTRHFGRGLVPTVFDFGRKGSPPSHPELLDWLATELMQQKWSMKQIHRMIVLSNTWKLSSSARNADPATIKADPDNRWYWRANPVRMEAQVVRDSLLALAGQLDLTLGGPTIPVADDSSRRRSLYYFHSHNEHQRFLSMFDDANVLECYRRADSIVPQQALALENSPLVMDMASRITQQFAQSNPQATDEMFVHEAFLLVLGAPPQPAELTVSLNALNELRAAADESATSESVTSESASRDAKVRTAFIIALLNHNDFVTVR